MKNRPNPQDKPNPMSSNLPKCFCCAFSVLEEIRLRQHQNSFAGLYAAVRLWRPPANRRLVMHHTDGFVGES